MHSAQLGALVHGIKGLMKRKLLTYEGPQDVLNGGGSPQVISNVVDGSRRIANRHQLAIRIVTRSYGPERRTTTQIRSIRQEEKILIGQKYRTQKNGLHIFQRSIFLPIQGHSVQVVALLVFSVGFWKGSPVFTTTRSTASRIPQKTYSHNSVTTTTTIQPVKINEIRFDQTLRR